MPVKRHTASVNSRTSAVSRTVRNGCSMTAYSAAPPHDWQDARYECVAAAATDVSARERTRLSVFHAVRIAVRGAAVHYTKTPYSEGIRQTLAATLIEKAAEGVRAAA